MALMLQQLQERSASPSELVLTCDDALEALTLLERGGARMLGWEGWLRYDDGRVGHSAQYQGTVDLSMVPAEQSYALCRTTITDAHAAYRLRPERLDAELLFCITYDV
jgi:hypothetical protein